MNLRTRAALAVVLATSFGLVNAVPATADDGGTPRKCGYYTDFAYTTAYYNHCVPQHGSKIQIEINKTFGDNQFKCVPPGVTIIGGAAFTPDAWATGKRC